MTKIELIRIANDFVNDFKDLDINLDFSPSSLELVEDYISETVKNPGEATRKSYFANDTFEKLSGFGCYTGEVIRRNTVGVRWKSADVESPIELILENYAGATGFVVNKVFKRFYEGDGDNVYHFALVMINNLFKNEVEVPKDFFDDEDKLIDKYGRSSICMYSNKISENDGIVNSIYQEDGFWIFAAGNEKDLENSMEFTFLDWVKEKHPEFKDLLKESEKSRIIRQKDGTYKLQEAHSGLFYDSHTIPSFQGDMKVNYFQWIKTHPKKTIYSIGALVLGYYLMTKIHWIFIIVFIGALLYNLWYWITIRNQFKGGDVNPGKVISLDPILVAVATDMRKFVGDFPILIIIETKLNKIDQKIGTIVPTVALYNDNPHGYPFWSKFDPVPVSLGITDQKQIDYLKSQFSDDDLNLLDDYIEQVSETKVGVYKINEEVSGWKDYKHVDLNKGINMEGPIEKED